MDIFNRKKRGPVPRLNLYQRARVLGVTPQHLSMVLSGKRQSRILTLRFQRLVQTEISRKTNHQTPSIK